MIQNLQNKYSTNSDASTSDSGEASASSGKKKANYISTLARFILTLINCIRNTDCGGSTDNKDTIKAILQSVCAYYCDTDEVLSAGRKVSSHILSSELGKRKGGAYERKQGIIAEPVKESVKITRDESICAWPLGCIPGSYDAGKLYLLEEIE